MLIILVFLLVMFLIAFRHYVKLLIPFNVVIMRYEFFTCYVYVCVSSYLLQDFPILCQTCLGDNPYIRMVNILFIAFLLGLMKCHKLLY